MTAVNAFERSDTGSASRATDAALTPVKAPLRPVERVVRDGVHMVPAPPTTDPAKSSTWTAALVVLVAGSMASMMEWGSASRPIHVALLKMVNSLGLP